MSIVLLVYLYYHAPAGYFGWALLICILQIAVEALKDFVK